MCGLWASFEGASDEADDGHCTKTVRRRGGGRRRRRPEEVAWIFVCILRAHRQIQRSHTHTHSAVVVAVGQFAAIWHCESAASTGLDDWPGLDCLQFLVRAVFLAIASRNSLAAFNILRNSSNYWNTKQQFTRREIPGNSTKYNY